MIGVWEMADNVRATTISQRFGFQDPDLKTPGHDEIMIWLDTYAETILQTLIPEKRWDDPDVPYPDWYLRVTKKEWEQPIADGKYIIGFADMVVKYEIPTLEIWERAGKVMMASERMAYFEVKTFIPSVGELIRQINMYRKYEYGTYIVVSPDNRFESVLKSQGILFFQCPAL
jgi:hypothetical protein